MTSRDLKELLSELEDINLSNRAVALAELRSVLSAVIEHLYFRQEEKENAR